MKKLMKRVLLTIIITMLVVAPFVQADSVEGADAVSVGSKNMINMQVVDQFGNNINFGEITMKDKNGADYAKMNLATGELSTEAPRVMKMGQGFTLLPTDVQKFIKSGTVVGVSAPDMKKASLDYSNMLLENGSNAVRIWYEPNKADYILDANTVALVVDPKWENDASNPEIKINGKYININKNIGTTLYKLEAGTYRPMYLLGSGSSGASIVSVDKKTEYFKTKIKLSELDGRFDDENNIVFGADVKGKIAANTYYYSGVVFFISGGIITVPVPDLEGYVEIYVDKSTGIFKYEAHAHMPGHSYSVGSSSIYGYNKIDTCLKPQSASKEGFSLMGVAEGEYTVDFESGKSEYLSVAAKAIEIKNSDDVQTITITVHKHDYSGEFKFNDKEHWKECSCGNKKDIKTHSINYSEYTFDEKIHWYQCSECNYKLDETEHNFELVIDFEATEDAPGQKHEECAECSYKKEAIEIPQIIVETEAPTEQDTTIAETEAETESETEVQIKDDSEDNNNWVWIESVKLFL